MITDIYVNTSNMKVYMATFQNNPVNRFKMAVFFNISINLFHDFASKK